MLNKMITDNRLTKALTQNCTLSYAIGSILILSKNALSFSEPDISNDF